MSNIILTTRPWIKLRLAADLLAHTAFAVVERWKGERMAAAKLARAIALYDELERGETFLCQEYFPFLLKGHGQLLHKVYEAPMTAPKLEIVEANEDDLLANFMDGLGV